MLRQLSSILRALITFDDKPDAMTLHMYVANSAIAGVASYICPFGRRKQTFTWDQLARQNGCVCPHPVNASGAVVCSNNESTAW